MMELHGSTLRCEENGKLNTTSLFVICYLHQAGFPILDSKLRMLRNILELVYTAV